MQWALQSEQQKKLHSYEQLEKVFYPHQLDMIKNGQALESTMPTNPSEACVICFDIVGSSRIRHERSKEFMRRVLLRCNQAMMESYDARDMRANAYRIKEMGDGFLCSVGYPFASATGNPTRDAVDLAMVFYGIFLEEVEKLGYGNSLHCGIGIARGSIEGFYPESGTKEYDLYGRAIVLANRYEAMRKTILQDSPPGSLLILQERVHGSLPLDMRARFQAYDLQKHSTKVRDDENATYLYYQALNEGDQTLLSAG